MFTIKYHLNFFLIIFVLSMASLYGIEIRFFDCNGKKLDPKEIEFARKWKEAAENTINNQDVIDCLPDNWKSSAETWMKYRMVQIKICRQKLHKPTDCGNLQRKFIVVPEANNSGCGCAEASVFHEFIHQAVPVEENETNDRKIRGCERLILSRFIKNCQDNPPPGAECDCMDQQRNQSPCRDPFEPPFIRKQKQ